LFRASFSIEAQTASDFIPIAHLIAEQFPQLFSSLRKTASDQFYKQLIIPLRQFQWIARQHSHDCGIDIRLREENRCWDLAQILYAMMQWHEQCKRSAITSRWRRGKTPRHLIL